MFKTFEECLAKYKGEYARYLAWRKLEDASVKTDADAAYFIKENDNWNTRMIGMRKVLGITAEEKKRIACEIKQL